ncbi:MAG: diaminopimelate epimerase [Balneolaceae bacterium]|nr:diaminopimelate epimerase [Balneolaceae bacterium]
MAELKFYKMQGAGNDFVVFDNRDYGFTLNEIIEITPRLCNRKFGIGADGLMALAPPQLPNTDYTMIYRNADGSDAGMCGNGARCLSLFANRQGFEAEQRFNVHQNIYKAIVSSQEKVSIHFPVTVHTEQLEIDNELFIKANAGTEHLVCFVEENSLKDEDHLVEEGRNIRMNDKVNPPGANVNFVYIAGKGRLSLQTYERGVENLTLACGTGALASAIAAHDWEEKGESHAHYQVSVKGGELESTFDFNTDEQSYNNLILTGPAYFVFEGIIHL